MPFYRLLRDTDGPWVSVFCCICYHLPLIHRDPPLLQSKCPRDPTQHSSYNLNIAQARQTNKQILVQTVCRGRRVVGGSGSGYGFGHGQEENQIPLETSLVNKHFMENNSRGERELVDLQTCHDDVAKDGIIYGSSFLLSGLEIFRALIPG